MAAYEEIYNFEDALEGAWSSIFTDQLATLSLNVQVVVTREYVTKVTPRFELELVNGQALLQRTAIGQTKQVANAFEATLVARIVTTRPLNDQNDALHGRLRGLARWWLSAGAKLITNANLPNHQILEQLPSGTTPKLLDEKECDISELHYAVKFAIRNEAWPP